MGLRRLGFILVLVIVFATACGGDDDGASEDGGVSLDEPIGASSQTGPSSTTATEGQSSVAKSAFAALEVARRDLDSAAQSVVDIATAPDVGGFLVSSVFDAEDGYGAARVIVNVPSPAFEEVVGKLGSIGEVTRQELAGENLSPELVNAQEAVRRARSRTTHLLERLDRADDDAARFRLRERIRESREKLRSVNHEASKVEADVALASIEVALRATPPPAVPEKPALERAVAMAKTITLAIASGAVLLAGVLVPIAGLLAILFFLGAPILRRLKPRLQKWPA